MKLLILADINSSHTKKWVEGICSSGIEVGVFSLREATEDWVNKYPNLSVFPSKKPARFIGKLGYLKQISTVKQIVMSFQPTIIHAHYATSYGLLGVLSRHPRLFISVWGSDVFEFPKTSFLHKALLKYILSKAEKLFSTSRIMAKETKKYTSKSLEIIPFGVNTSQFFPKASMLQNQLTIGTVKTLDHTYGIDRLIKATILLKNKFPNLHCHIYGNGPLKEEFEQFIYNNNAEKYITLMGSIPHQEVVNAVNEMDVFCNLSRRESFGVAVLEALACEVPVVVTNVGGLPEVVVHETTGLICDENLKDIVKNIEKLLKNNENRQILGENGRKWVLKHYNWEANLAQMVSFYY